MKSPPSPHKEGTTEDGAYRFDKVLTNAFKIPETFAQLAVVAVFLVDTNKVLVQIYDKLEQTCLQ